MPDAEQFRRLRQIHASLRRLNAIEPEAQVLLHAQMRKEARFLKHIAERPLVRRQKDVAIGIEPHFAIDDEPPDARPREPREASQERGLAGTGMAEDRG